ncbi:MAG: hypothetical protein CMM07_17730 [Rhodopirellula sp.]|nr:hypothetical protein [Rhodopirellula sp.]HCA36859.1 hypothetical protein [Gammaproteobacteria bacterium]
MFYFLTTDTPGDVVQSPVFWNILAPNTTNLAVKDEAEQASPLTVSVPGVSLYPNLVSVTQPWSGPGSFYNQTVGDPLWINQSSFFEFATVNNLDDTKNYVFEFVGAYESATDRVARIKINGGGEVQYQIPQQPNITTETITISGVTSALIEVANTVTGSSYILGFRVYEDVPPADTTPPVYEVAPAVTETRENGHTISGTADEDSVFYGVRLPAGATVPTSQQVIDGQDASSSPALEADFVAASAGISADLDFVTASASTGYRYAVVAVDDEPTPNVQATPTVIDDTTAAAVVEGISAQTIRDKAGDLTPNATNLKIAVRESSDPESTVHFSTTNGSLNGSSQTSAINLESAGVTVGDTVHFSYFNPALNEGLNVDLTVEDIA